MMTEIIADETFHGPRVESELCFVTFRGQYRPTDVIRILLITFVLATAQFSSRAWAETKVSPPVDYAGMCDASAAVALTDRLFAVASDEDSVIRVYSREQGGPPVQSIDLTTFL